VYQGIKDAMPLKEEEKLFVTSDRFIPGTKKAGEILCLLYGKEYGMEVISVRLTRVYGPLYRGIRSPIGHMVENAVKGIPVTLENYDPGESHDFVYVKDAARAITLLLEAPTLRHRIYNLGSGRLMSIGEFAEAIKSLLPEAEIHFGDRTGSSTPTKTPMDINACVDISRLSQETGFTPEYDLYRGVEHYIRWARDGIYS
jgi:UDP-glucose 4-epimerase